jgi:hypothetical protein
MQWRLFMAICKDYEPNFKTLKRAFRGGDVALMEVLDTRTDKVSCALVAVGRDGTDYVFTPFAIMCEGNPYEYLRPPIPGSDGFAPPE